MTPDIRPATLADIPALREMLVATWHATYDATLGVEKVNAIAASWHSLEKLGAECAAAQANPKADALLVAEAGGRIVGTASAHFLPDPNFRRAVGDFLEREREAAWGALRCDTLSARWRDSLRAVGRPPLRSPK